MNGMTGKEAKKDFFGNEYPTYEERLALTQGAKLCIEAGKITQEAVALLEGADNRRLYTFLLDHAFIVTRNSDLMTDVDQWHARVMNLVVSAVFQDFSDITEALDEIDETKHNTIKTYLESIELYLDRPGVSKAFFALCAGRDIWVEQVVQHRKTGEIVKREKTRIKGHDALRRAAIAAQMVNSKDFEEHMDEYIAFLSAKVEEERHACVGA